MKNFLIFLAGMITGAALLFGVAYFYNNSSSSDNGITMFEQEGDVISTSSFKVIQVVDGGALAMEQMDDMFGLPTGLVVLFVDETENGYYDSQSITIPKGKCARQVGVYRYVTKESVEKTVPAVAIRKK